MNEGVEFTGNAELLKNHKYLKCCHLQGKATNLSIEHVQVEKLESRDRGDDREMLVMYFKGKRLGFGLSANCNIDKMVELHGKMVKKWKGKRIKLFPTTCQAFGKTVDCVRIDKASATKADQEPPDEPEHEEPPFSEPDGLEELM